MNDEQGYIELDTRYVLNRYFRAETLRGGLIAFKTPIFDNLAAERFARD